MTSTGIEPFFSFEWQRKSRLGTHTEYVQVYKDWLDQHPGEPIPDYFVTAQDITPEEHVKVQAAIQRWVDSAISKTVNLPSSATVEDVANVYTLMYNMGAKGGTVYRDQSRHDQVLRNLEECPECKKQSVVSESGCKTCQNCGWSVCTI